MRDVPLMPVRGVREAVISDPLHVFIIYVSYTYAQHPNLRLRLRRC